MEELEGEDLIEWWNEQARRDARAMATLARLMRPNVVWRDADAAIGSSKYTGNSDRTKRREKLDLSSFDTSQVESAMLLWEAPPAVLKELTVGENFDLPLLRENAAPAAGGTINGQPWEDFLS